MKQDAENERQLQTLDPERREQLIQLEKGRVESAAELLKLREDVRSLECSYLQGKQSLKRLRYGLSARGGAQWTYNLQRDEFLKEYVLNRALAVVVASYLKKDVADPPRTTQSYENSANNERLIAAPDGL